MAASGANMRPQHKPIRGRGSDVTRENFALKPQSKEPTHKKSAAWSLCHGFVSDSTFLDGLPL